jgi:hypothetical protein
MLVEATRVAAHRDAAVKPPRLNFARICLYCGERDCAASRCIEFYERSRWMVCPDGDGQEWSELLEPCGCMFGVVEAAPDSDRRESSSGG